MGRIKAKDELYSDKTKNAVTSDEYILHGNRWLGEVVDGISAEAGKKANKDYVDAELAKKANVSTVTELTNTVDTKASAADVTALQTKTATLETTVSGKADNTTVSSLSERVAENTTKTVDLQSQIDSLVIEAGGDSNPEVVQARTDASGVTHATLKSRIDSEVTDLKSEISELNKVYDNKVFPLQPKTWNVIKYEMITGKNYVVRVGVDSISDVTVYTSVDGRNNKTSVPATINGMKDRVFTADADTPFIKVFPNPSVDIVIECIDTFVNDIYAKQDNIEKDMTTVKSDISAINSGIDSVNADILDVRGKINDIYNQVTADISEKVWNVVKYSMEINKHYVVRADVDSISDITVYTSVDGRNNKTSVPVTINGMEDRVFTADADTPYIKAFANSNTSLKLICIDTVINNITKESSILKSDISNVEINLVNYDLGKFFINSSDVENGSIDANGNNLNYKNDFRLRPKTKVKYFFDVELVPTGSKIYIVEFGENGDVINTPKWHDSAAIVKAGTAFKFIVTPSTTEDIPVSPEDISKYLMCAVANKERNGNAIPKYYFADNYISDKISDINAKSCNSENTISFAFITDVHINNNAGNGMKLAKYISDKTNCVPFVIYGGDTPITRADSPNDIWEQANKWIEMMTAFDKTKVFQMRGNHDYLGVAADGTEYYFTKSECKKIITGNIDCFNNVQAGAMYYYIDFESYNARFVFLDTCDNAWSAEQMKGYAGVSQEQIDWLVDDALNCENKKIVVFSHIATDSSLAYYSELLEPIQEVLKALKNRTQLNYSNSGITISKDFRNSSNEFVAHFSGHAHKDESHVDNNVLSIATNCDALYNDISGYPRNIGTITEQSFDIVSIDFKNKQIFTTRIGAGADRNWTY